jgi:hypothetical protein
MYTVYVSVFICLSYFVSHFLSLSSLVGVLSQSKFKDVLRRFESLQTYNRV